MAANFTTTGSDKYPAGVCLEVKQLQHNTDTTDQTVSSTAYFGFGTQMTIAVPDDNAVLMMVSGGMLEFDGGTDWGPCVNFAVDAALGSATAGTFGAHSGTNVPASKQNFGPVQHLYSNTSGSATELKFRCGMKGWTGTGVTARWFGDGTLGGSGGHLEQFLVAYRIQL